MECLRERSRTFIFRTKPDVLPLYYPSCPLLLSQAAIRITNKNNLIISITRCRIFTNTTTKIYEFLSCEIIGAKDGFEPSSYRDISYTIYHWKYFAQYFIVGMVRYHQFESHAYRRILLSVSSRAANYAPQRLTMLHGELSATSPAHHRMAINHLLQRFCMMPFLGLVATHWRKVWLLLKELWTLLSAFFIKGFPCTWFFKVWAGRSRTYEELIFPACPLHSYGIEKFTPLSVCRWYSVRW